MKTLACALSLAIVTALVGCSAEAPKPATPPATSMPGADHANPTTPPGGHEPAAAEGEKKEGDAAAAPEGEKKEGDAAAPAEPEKKPE